MLREFTKVEGLGNDFVLFDLRDHGPTPLSGPVDALRRRAPELCDRRLGVGADGLLLVTAPADPRNDAAMIVFNADGSRPEMCGNGIRCVALALRTLTAKDDLRIETDAGLRRCRFETGETGTAWVRVDMGPCRILGPRHPQGTTRAFLAVSMGNPHAVAYVDPGEDPEDLARRLGPGLETDPLFPDRTNVEFARFETDGSVTVWVWERGVGITQACGTGACATAAAAVHLQLAAPDQDLAVHLPGGTLRIRVPGEPAAGVQMSGPARLVYRGRLSS